MLSSQDERLDDKTLTLKNLETTISAVNKLVLRDNCELLGSDQRRLSTKEIEITEHDEEQQQDGAVGE